MKSIESKLKEYFDAEILSELKPLETLDEIRIHRGGRIFIRRENENIPVDRVVSDGMFTDILDKLCKHSYHTYADMIAKGFIPLGDGFRCGVSGVALCQDNRIENIYPVNDLVIRIPHLIRGVSKEIFNLIENKRQSILIYSRPCEGKTTLIRDIAIRLADYPNYKRVCIIDEKNEIIIGDMSRYSLLTAYSLFPKDKAAAFCIASMSPDYVICDEIVSTDDANSLMLCHGSGVGIIATTHANSYEGAISRKQIAELYRNSVFDAYVGIKRRKNGYDFEITNK